MLLGRGVILLLALCVGMTVTARCQSPPPTANRPKAVALQEVADTADRICGIVATSGSSTSESVSGQVNAELTGLLKRLAGLDIGGSGSVQHRDYVNVIRSDLPEALRSMQQCKLQVFDHLLKVFFPDHQSIEDCINKELAVVEDTQVITTPQVPARAPGPGLWGGQKTATEPNCLKAPPGYTIIGAVKVIPGGCNDSRCSISPVSYSKSGDLVTQACVQIKAWSESKSGGAGGWNSAALTGTVGLPVNDKKRAQIRQECSAF